MKVLVTGGGGFLGSAICRQLLARGADVVAFQRSPAPAIEAIGARVVSGDLQDMACLTEAMSGCDAVVHTAGKAGVWGAYEDYYRVNVLGTENVISACRSVAVRTLVYTSSPSVVHGGGDIEGGDESLPYPAEFHSPYPATKALAEQLAMAASNDSLHTTGIRPHLVWGPGDPHLLPRLLERSSGGVLKLPGRDKLIDTIFVENAAQAHLLALDELRGQARCAGKTYFVSNDQPLPQGEIIAGLLAAAGRECEIRTVPPGLAIALGTILQSGWKIFGRSGEPPLTRWSAEQLSTAHWYDISAAKRDFGYGAGISIKQGLETLAEHFGVTAPDPSAHRA
ncbi:MAG: NAD-dependent epimerase/dehydratase family protein [Xanthomonadales bacterium]|nr:NAD-dependent epimerase/dehydratase family protein [Xanthomonadales bacterium]